jgi:hypothetical protein
MSTQRGVLPHLAAPRWSSGRLQEGINAIPQVIYHIETFDTTTVRASTPMFLMAKRINEMGVKMVISGEGSDEVFGGYLYFHKAPNKVGSAAAECKYKSGRANPTICCSSGCRAQLAPPVLWRDWVHQCPAEQGLG